MAVLWKDGEFLLLLGLFKGRGNTMALKEAVTRYIAARAHKTSCKAEVGFSVPLTGRQALPSQVERPPARPARVPQRAHLGLASQRCQCTGVQRP